MLRFFKFVALALIFIGNAFSASAFSLLGPNAPWQTRYLGYGGGGAPMDIAEEYRWNTPVLTYAYDATFLNFFGSNGVAAVEEAIAILNALPKASEVNLDNYPREETQRYNYEAAALNLTDLKSTALAFLIEEMGLTSPESYVWTLRDRVVINFPAPPDLTNYFLMQRNFDPDTFEPSSYINGAFYTYVDIFDNQSANIQTQPDIFPLDPLDARNASSVVGKFPLPGGFYLGLSRDDVGGLRYLLRTNNYNVERLLSDVRIVSTNATTPIALETQDLALLAERTQNTTNDPAALLALYPELLITKTNTYLGFDITTNIFSFFTNYPCFPRQVFSTNKTTNVVQRYTYEVGNVVTNTFFTNRQVLVQTVEVVPATNFSPGLPLFQTNILESHFETQFVTNGEFYIAPTNLLGYSFVSNVLTTVTNSTNIDFFAISLLTTRTNDDQLSLLETIDLATFSDQARTNDPAAILTLYPELLILSSNLYFTNIVTSNLVQFFTNFPFDPAGSLTLTQQAFYSTNVGTNWSYKFGNVVSNFGMCAPFDSGLVTIEQSLIANNPFDPAGTTPTNVFTSTTILSNYPNGSLYIVPTNLFGYARQFTQLVTLTFVTNSFVFTNFAQGIAQTNVLSIIRPATNYFLAVYPIEILTTNDLSSNFFGIRREVIAYVTNTIFEVYPVTAQFPSNSVGLRPGVDKISFRRVENESFLGNNFLAVTNDYLDTVIISNQVVQQRVWRTSQSPDVLFTAKDLGTAPNGNPVTLAITAATSATWENNAALNTSGGFGTNYGPGVIGPPINISFSKIVPNYYNYRFGDDDYFTTPVFLGQLGQGTRNANRDFTTAWGSFNASNTNALIVYPLGTSVRNLENQILNPTPP